MLKEWSDNKLDPPPPTGCKVFLSLFLIALPLLVSWVLFRSILAALGA